MKCFLEYFVVVVAVFSTGFCDSNVEDTIGYSFDVYRALYNANENTVFSPFSFRVILSVLYQGAVGETSADLKAKIFKNDQSSVYSTQTKNLAHILTSPSVKLANKIYLKQGSSLLPSFKSIVEGYHSDIEQVDFSKAADVSNNINEWVESKTNGLIKNLVSADSVTPDTALFLVNTVYFKAKWAEPYSPLSVLTSTFNNFDGSKSSIPFITDVGFYKVAAFGQAQVVEIPYEVNSNFVFWIILPNSDSTIDQLKNNLNNEFVQNTKTGLHESRYDISFPIFEIESSVDGKEVFSKLGLSSLFNKYELNLLASNDLLKVDEMKQKSKIIVNTEGTEAASATYAKAIPMSMFPSIRIDRPFVYAVLTADEHVPIFVGHFSHA